MGSPSPSPEIPEAMVEAGARAMLDYESESVTFTGRDAEMLRTITRHVLTAALRLDDPEGRTTLTDAIMDAQADLQTALGWLRLAGADAEIDDRLAQSLARLHALLAALGRPMYNPAAHPKVEPLKLALVSPPASDPETVDLRRVGSIIESVRDAERMPTADEWEELCALLNTTDDEGAPQK